MMDDLHAITGGLYFRQDMCRQDDAMLLAEFADQSAYLADLDRVETDGWFIKDDYRRVMDDCLRDTGTLLVTLGEVADQPP